MSNNVDKIEIALRFWTDICHYTKESFAPIQKYLAGDKDSSIDWRTLLPDNMASKSDVIWEHLVGLCRMVDMPVPETRKRFDWGQIVAYTDAAGAIHLAIVGHASLPGPDVEYFIFASEKQPSPYGRFDQVCAATMAQEYAFWEYFNNKKSSRAVSVGQVGVFLNFRNKALRHLWVTAVNIEHDHISAYILNPGLPIHYHYNCSDLFFAGLLTTVHRKEVEPHVQCLKKEHSLSTPVFLHEVKEETKSSELAKYVLPLTPTIDFKKPHEFAYIHAAVGGWYVVIKDPVNHPDEYLLCPYGSGEKSTQYANKWFKTADLPKFTESSTLFHEIIKILETHAPHKLPEYRKYYAEHSISTAVGSVLTLVDRAVTCHNGLRNLVLSHAISDTVDYNTVAWQAERHLQERYSAPMRVSIDGKKVRVTLVYDTSK